MKILYIAEITGKAGIWLVKKKLKDLKKEYQSDFVIANANSATGSGGLGRQHAAYLRKLGVDCITAGDSIFQKQDLVEVLDKTGYVLRPYNLPTESPGKGWRFLYSKQGNEKLAVVSILGRIGLHRIMAENPYTYAEELVKKLKQESKFILVDIASAATGEKQAFSHMLDGQVSAVIGSCAKAQTTDNCILKNGTAYITDAGRTGSLNSVGGYGIEEKIREYKTCLPDYGREAWDKPCIQGLSITLNPEGKATKIERIFQEVDSGN